MNDATKLELLTGLSSLASPDDNERREAFVRDWLGRLGSNNLPVLIEKLLAEGDYEWVKDLLDFFGMIIGVRPQNFDTLKKLQSALASSPTTLGEFSKAFSASLESAFKDSRAVTRRLALLYAAALTAPRPSNLAEFCLAAIDAEIKEPTKSTFWEAKPFDEVVPWAAREVLRSDHARDPTFYQAIVNAEPKKRAIFINAVRLEPPELNKQFAPLAQRELNAQLAREQVYTGIGIVLEVAYKLLFSSDLETQKSIEDAELFDITGKAATAIYLFIILNNVKIDPAILEREIAKRRLFTTTMDHSPGKNIDSSVVGYILEAYVIAAPTTCLPLLKEIAKDKGGQGMEWVWPQRAKQLVPLARGLENPKKVVDAQLPEEPSLADLQALEEPLCKYFMAEGYERHVFFDGLEGFVTGFYGQFLELASRALSAIGAKDQATIIDEIISSVDPKKLALNQTGSADEATREEIGKFLSRFDQRVSGIGDLIGSYVARHAGAFRPRAAKKKAATKAESGEIEGKSGRRIKAKKPPKKSASEKTT